MEEQKGKEEWGKAFEWEIKGARVDEVWAVTGNFASADKWAPSLVQSCDLVEGQPQRAGCVRRVVIHPHAPGQPPTYALEKLLEMDEAHHRYSYTILEATLPGFSLLQDYVSTFKLSPLHAADLEGTLLQWSFVCRPVSALHEAQAHHIAFSLFQAAVNDLKARLSLPDDSVFLLSEPA